MFFELTTIGQYATVQGGYAFKSKDFQQSGYLPVLKIKNVRHGYVEYSDCAYVNMDIALACEKWRTSYGDILISMTGSGPSAPESLVGRVARVWESEPTALINQRVGKLVLKEGQSIDKDFLFYVLTQKTSQEFLVSNATGSANQVNISSATIESVPCPNITYRESHQISCFLNMLNQRERLLRETNATLEAIAQALFKSWFVDFDPVHARARGEQPAGLAAEVAALFPDSFEESALGLVPNGWRWRTMDDVSTVGIGKTPPRKEPQWFSDNLDDVPWVSIKDMGTAGVFINKTSEFLTSASIDRFNVRVVPDNTVLLSFKLTVGRLSITDGEMVTNEAIAHFKLGEDSPLSSAYIYLALRQFNFESLSSTSSIAEAVNSKTVRAIPILVPSPSLVTMFNDYANPIFNRIKLLEKQAQTLANLRDTLLPRLISGQLRLPEAEQQLKDLAV